MSDFTGVTFANQKIAPSDDAIVRRAILPDGILTGCALTYSGSTLTMAAGHLMACGRQIRHPAAQNWAVVDATSGYARLVMTIDLTRTATKEVFDQVTHAVEYASSEDGFVELEQSDINVSGTRYQVAICVVSLGTGGITGIVSQLEKSAVDGSGALNFSVVGGTTQPTDPKENTIWVNTSEEITSWVFSAEEPAEPAEGMIWISVGESSSVAFSVVKKNAIMVYPLSVSQYVGGSWVRKDAWIWQDGEWKEFAEYLYNYGDLGYVWTTVAKKQSNEGGAGSNEPTVTTDANGIMKIYQSGSYDGGICYIAEKIDLSNYKTLTFSGVLFQNSSTASHAIRARLCIWSDIGTYISDNVVKSIESPVNGAVSVDVSDLNGSYYIGFGVHHTGSYVDIKYIDLRK